MSEPTKEVKPEAAPSAPSAPAVTDAGADTGNDAKKKNNMNLIIGAAVVVVLLIAIASALGHKKPDSTKVSSTGNGTATIKTSNGDQITTGSSQTLPKDFPTSVLVYNGTIVNSSRLTIDGKIDWSAVIETKDDPASVGATLSQNFSAHGWTTSLDNKTTDGGLIAADNSITDLHVQVIYVTKDGKTTISYTVVSMPAATQ